MNGDLFLCRLDDLPDGEARGFDPLGTGRDTLFVVRQGERLHAWQDRCPHEGDTPLPWRRHAYLNVARTRIVCYAHGAQFDIASGVCLIGPCKGLGLSAVELRITAGGEVFVGADRDRAVPQAPAPSVSLSDMEVGHDPAR